MLVLSRRLGEEIIIAGGIRVIVVGVKGNQVRLGVAAPPSITVDRQEVAQLRSHEPATIRSPVKKARKQLALESV
jgi:carbon storage regulator